MENAVPSLADLLLLVLNESFPDQGWCFNGSVLLSRFGWMFGRVNDDSFECIDTEDWTSMSETLLAGDPDFIEKFKVVITRIRDCHIKLFLDAEMPVIPPEFTLAS